MFIHSFFKRFFMLKKLPIIAVVVFSFLMASCSTIFNGDKSQVKVNSTPSDAKVFVNGNEMGRTPAVLNLKRGERHVIEIKMDGYQTYKLETSKTITGWFWGNLVCGGILGFVIDLATGNAYDVDPGFIQVTLEKSTGMLEQFHMEDFGGIKLYDKSGKELAQVDIVWE